MGSMAAQAGVQCRPSTSGTFVEAAIRTSSALLQCGCGRSSSSVFGTPIPRVLHLIRPAHPRLPIQPVALKYEYKSSSSGADLTQAPITSKSSLSMIKDAVIEAQPPQDQKLKLRVDFNGKATQRAYDTVVRSLAKNAPPVPGFRKAKGGKTSIVPASVLVNMMGMSRVRKFVVEEIVRTTLVEYVEMESIKAKKELATDQTADELDAEFEPGKDFGFNATLELENETEAEPKSETADSEVLAA